MLTSVSLQGERGGGSPPTESATNLEIEPVQGIVGRSHVVLGCVQ